MKRHELTDEQWALVEPHLPASNARTGRPASDRRTLLNAIFWILITGAPWRDLPERFGPWQTAYHHFSTWRKNGICARIIETLQIKLDQRGRCTNRRALTRWWPRSSPRERSDAAKSRGSWRGTKAMARGASATGSSNSASVR